MKNKLFLFALLALGALSVLSSCEKNPYNVPGPYDKYETQRAYTEESENVSVSMPESTVYIRGDEVSDLLSYDQSKGTITFRQSEAIKYQRIREGDILYSTDRTAQAPNGYCLLVKRVIESGATVTYETEPASALDAIGHAKESNIVSFGNYRPEDIHMYIMGDADDPAPDTKSDYEFKLDDGAFELKGEKFDFKSDGQETSFKVVLWEDKESANDVEGSLKLKLGVKVQHEILNQNTESYYSAEEGNIVLFLMARIGVGFTVEFGNDYQLKPGGPDENDPDYWKKKTAYDQAKASLVGKRFRLLDVPLNCTATKLLIDPRLVVYGEFKLDIKGKIVVEGGVENGVYALNFANDGYDFKKLSYFNKITDLRPYFDIKASLDFEASAGFGVGLNLEFPSVPVTDGSYTAPSAAGVWLGAEAKQSVGVTLDKDFISGRTKLTVKGKEGTLKTKARFSGIFGIKKHKVTFDWAFWTDEVLKIPEWETSFLLSTPTPYNLKSSVTGSSAILSWSKPDDAGFEPRFWVYVDEMLAGNPTTVYKSRVTETSVVYGPVPDGAYRWKAEIRSEDGKKFTSEADTFEINNSSVSTGNLGVGSGYVRVPVTVNTLNEVSKMGVTYSSDYSSPSADADETIVYNGKDSSFSISIEGIKPGVTYYVRGFALIKKNGGYFYIYGDTKTIKLDPPMLTIDPEELDFGDVTVGETESMSFTMTNDGGADLDVYSITCPDGFSTPFDSWSNKVVFSGRPRRVVVSFTPESARNYSGTLIIKSNAGDNPVAVVKLSGTGKNPPKPSISVSPSSVQFKDAEAGTRQIGTITITNTGDATLTISSISLREGSRAFVLPSTYPTVIAARGSDSFKFRFAPPSVGSFYDYIVIKSNASNIPELSIPISGKGISADTEEKDYIDLGLSVKWATKNIGADSPEDYGDYYAWGEIKTKNNYASDTYKWYTNGSEIIKYNNNSSNGAVDNKDVLDKEDDVAYNKLGSKWHIPTDAEWEELINNCSWIWTTRNGVPGQLVTSNKPGYIEKSIFLPAAGYKYKTSTYESGTSGYYWSSSLRLDGSRGAWYVNLGSDNVRRGSNGRHRGASVRPVCTE